MTGHQKQWNFLKRALEKDKLPHALLFSGQEKIGKKTLALEFVKFLNCSFPKAPCQKCRNCRDIENKRFPDLVFIDSEKEIQISQIRDLITRLSLKAHSSPLKVSIIDKAHTMTREAQSCFLKLLEEPKGRTLFILITEYPETMLSTIISRVQTIKFFPIKKEDVKKHLQEKGASLKEAEKLADVSSGKLGLALDFLEDSEKLKEREQIISDLLELKDSDFSYRFSYAKKLDQGSEDVLFVWLDYLRKVLVSKIEKKDSSSFKNYPFSKLLGIIKEIQSTLFLLATTNVNPKLSIENLLIKL